MGSSSGPPTPQSQRVVQPRWSRSKSTPSTPQGEGQALWWSSKSNPSSPQLPPVKRAFSFEEGLEGFKMPVKRSSTRTKQVKQPFQMHAKLRRAKAAAKQQRSRSNPSSPQMPRIQRAFTFSEGLEDHQNIPVKRRHSSAKQSKHPFQIHAELRRAQAAAELRGSYSDAKDSIVLRAVPTWARRSSNKGRHAYEE